MLSAQELLPAVGQGILGVEVRAADQPILEALGGLDDAAARAEALAERAFLRCLSAGCHTPVAGLARLAGATIEMDGLVSSLDGRTVIRGRAGGPATRPEAVGESLAGDLLSRGARAILDEGGRA